MLSTASAQANDTASQPSEAGTQQVWPTDCTRDIQRDGLVLIDGALGDVSVSLRPSDASEDLPGSFGTAAGETRVWQTSEALLPQTEYRLFVQPLDANGEAAGEALLSHFTTGDALREAPGFQGVPAARVLPHTAAAIDGASFGAESLRDDVVVLRIALPGLSGGLSHRPLALTAALLDDTSSEQALGARVLDTRRAAPNQPVAFQLQAVLDDEPRQRCVSITAQDEFGATIDAPELCLELPARSPSESDEAPYETEQAPQARELSNQTAELSLNAAHPSAGGCSVGSSHPARDLSWMLLAMLPFVARRRAARA